MLLSDINDFCDRAEKQLLARHLDGDADEMEREDIERDRSLERWEADRDDPRDEEEN